MAETVAEFDARNRAVRWAPASLAFGAPTHAIRGVFANRAFCGMRLAIRARGLDFTETERRRCARCKRALAQEKSDG